MTEIAGYFAWIDDLKGGMTTVRWPIDAGFEAKQAPWNHHRVLKKVKLTKEFMDPMPLDEVERELVKLPNFQMPVPNKGV